MAHFESPPSQTKLPQAASRTTETHDTSRLRFNSLTLDELSDELDRRTKETQRLQEEVENATKLTLEKFGCTYGIQSSTGQTQDMFNVYDSPGSSVFLSTHQQTVAEPPICDLDTLIQQQNRREISSPGREVLGNLIDDCLHQLSDLRLNKAHDQPQPQETFSVDSAVMNLQTKLHEAQMEKDVLSDQRLKDSRIHVGQMEKMLCLCEELQNITRATEEKKQEEKQEEKQEALFALNRKVVCLERDVKEMYILLCSNEKQCGHDNMQKPNVATSSRQISQAAELTKEFNNETDNLQKRLHLTIEELGSDECDEVYKHKERMEELIASLGQEMALLTDKLSSSRNNSDSLSDKLELLKKLAEKQTSLHRCQVCCLEQQLLHTGSQLLEAQRQRDGSEQHAEELQSQLDQLQRCGKQQHSEVQEEIKELRGRLVAAREEKSCLCVLLEQRDMEERKSQELLKEKHKKLQLRQQESQQHHSELQEAQCRCQALRLQLNDSEKMMGILRSQMESSIQRTFQNGHTIDTLHQENSLLSNQLNQHKLEFQQLRAELDQQKSHLAAAELKRRQLQASMAEQSQRVHQETLEKQQLTNQLEVQSMQLLTLNKEHKQLQQQHSCASEAHEGVVSKLQSQLRTACDELDKVSSTLRALEGADGHGLKLARDMQEKITARREQIDSLQVKTQHLEEIVEKLHQEKSYQSLEHQRQLKELAFLRKEKRHLANELEAFHSKDKQSRDRISQLEAILHKVSENFANCQDFIQQQEQEFCLLKLQHALVFKDLQGPNVHTVRNASPPELDSPSPSALPAPPSSQHASNAAKLQLESPARELRALVKELRGVISENSRPHTDNRAAGSGFHRRRSAPERVHKITFSDDQAEEVRARSRLRRKTCGSEPHFLKTAELPNGKISNKKSFNRVRFTESQQLLSPGRRSPVHSLLTSDPNSQQ